MTRDEIISQRRCRVLEHAAEHGNVSNKEAVLGEAFARRRQRIRSVERSAIDRVVDRVFRIESQGLVRLEDLGMTGRPKSSSPTKSSKTRRFRWPRMPTSAHGRDRMTQVWISTETSSMCLVSRSASRGTERSNCDGEQAGHHERDRTKRSDPFVREDNAGDGGTGGSAE